MGRHDATINGLTGFEGHEVITTSDVARTKNDGADSAAVGSVGDLLSNVKLDILTEFILEVMIIYMWEIVDEIAWA